MFSEWPGAPLKNHKTLSLLIHKLDFLADIGWHSSDETAAPVVSDILSSASPEGPFRIPILIPKMFGGSGEVESAWILTDAPVIVGALAKMGLAENSAVVRAGGFLVSLVRKNGWPCAADPVLGSGFKGPGKKEDSCPFGTLVTLRMMADLGFPADAPEAAAGIESLLNLWEHRTEKRPFLFGMGTDFLKLKAPFVWFDVLHFLNVLSRFPAARGDTRFLEILAKAEAQADDDGLYTPSSVYRPASGFDFGDKKKPSRWITFLMYRIRKRLKEA